MTPQELLLTVTYVALMQIREASSPGAELDELSRKKIFYLADLVMDIPVALQADEARGGDGSDVLAAVRKRAADRGVEAWLESAIQEAELHRAQ